MVLLVFVVYFIVSYLISGQRRSGETASEVCLWMQHATPWFVWRMLHHIQRTGGTAQRVCVCMWMCEFLISMWLRLTQEPVCCCGQKTDKNRHLINLLVLSLIWEKRLMSLQTVQRHASTQTLHAASPKTEMFSIFSENIFLSSCVDGSQRRPLFCCSPR